MHQISKDKAYLVTAVVFIAVVVAVDVVAVVVVAAVVQSRLGVAVIEIQDTWKSVELLSAAGMSLFN